jgi:predicted SnoaL-like aldol condensation-catalyzing enzyme
VSNLLEANKALVQAFYQNALNERDADVADSFLGDTYKQHNPMIEDDRAGLRKYLNWIRENFPQAKSEVVSVFAEGDVVILHVHRVRTPGTRGDAIDDIFRVAEGKIVEHWDVIRPIPETAVNGNTMF